MADYLICFLVFSATDFLVYVPFVAPGGSGNAVILMGCRLETTARPAYAS
jgi:hypothetical protein